MGQYFSVAIDGPSGAGKSTLAKLCASKFGLTYLDTGAFYRTVGLAVQRAGIGSKDAKGVEKLLPGLNIKIRHRPDGQRMLLNGEDVTQLIRTPEISIYASDVSAMPPVRAFLLEKQRRFAREGSVIMDGRDIGTVVLPKASLKIFLSATPEERADRRYKELLEKGQRVTYDAVLRDIRSRDENDSSRSLAPLVAAPDAIRVDTTGKSLEESFIILSKLIREKMGA
jgi:cytidylate kinase